MSTGNDILQFSLYIPLQAAGTDRKVYKTFEPSGEWYIEAEGFMPDDSVTANNTNYSTITATNETDTATLHTFHTKILGGTALTAGTAVANASITNGSARQFSQGDVISVSKADSGSGQALGGTYSFWLTRRRL